MAFNIEKSFNCELLNFNQRALTRQAENDWTSVQKFFLGSYINYTYPFKKHQGFLLNHLIVGANPILNFLLLKKIYLYAKQEKQKNSNYQPLKIGLLFPDVSDYWGYQFMKHKEFWVRLNKSYYNIEDTSLFDLNFDMINDFKDFYTNEDIATLYLIDNSDFEPGYVFSNKYSSEYAIQLVDKKEQKEDYHWFHQEKLGVLLKQQKKLSNKIHNDFLDKFEKFSDLNSSLKKLVYPEDKKISTEEFNRTPMHFLLTDYIWSTSYPYNWFPLVEYSIKKSELPDTYSNNEYFYTHLKHAYSISAFGSSKHTCNNFLGLEEQAIYDIIDVLNLDVKESINEQNKEKNARFINNKNNS